MNRLTLIVVGILLLIITLLGVQNFIQGNQLESAKDYKSLYEEQTQQAITWKDKHDHWRSRALVAEVSAKNLKSQIDKKDIKQIRENFPQINESFNNLQSFNQIATAHRDTFKIVLRDTVFVGHKGKHFVWSKGCYSISETIDGDTVYADFKSTDSLNVIIYWERSKFLGLKIGKKKKECEILSKCPDTPITFNKAIVEKPKKRKVFSLL